jgi:biopolymer transport protein ExbD
MTFYPRKRKMPQVIIVSLIDIFAILLIFVIVTTTFKQSLPPSVTIKLPESKTAVQAEKAEEPITLTISEQEEIFLDGKAVTVDELRAAVKELVSGQTKRTLALNADTKAPFGTVIRVLDVLREAGVKGNLAAFMDSKTK